MERSRPSKEQRRHPRYVLTQAVQVLDAVTQRSIGHMVNMSRQGCMLRSDKPFEMNSVYQLILVLPEPVGGRRRLNVELCCIWCQPSRYNHEFGAGFEIAKIRSEDQARWDYFCSG